MARLAGLIAVLQARLQTSQEQRMGQPTNASGIEHPRVPMSAATQRKLERLAEKASTPEHRVSPMQVATQLLEEAVAQLPDE